MKTIGLIVALAAAIAALVFRPHPTEATYTPANAGPHRPPHGHASHVPVAVDVYVAGAVAKPGVYPIAPTARVIDALRAAGGPRSDADLDSINLAAHVNDGDKIAVESHADRLAREARAQPRTRKTAAPKPARGRTKKQAPGTLAPIDLNTATADDLAGLPGIGPGLARRITDYRELNGPFDSLDDLADIDGVTNRTIDAIAPYVVVR